MAWPHLCSQGPASRPAHPVSPTSTPHLQAPCGSSGGPPLFPLRLSVVMLVVRVLQPLVVKRLPGVVMGEVAPGPGEEVRPGGQPAEGAQAHLLPAVAQR